MEELETKIREWNSPETTGPGSGDIWTVGLGID